MTRSRRPRSAAALTLAAALVVFAGKVAAYLVTGSVALLSDAAESVANVAAAVAVVIAVRAARRPPDFEHPYGHGKAEYLSSALEGSMILIAAGAILTTAFQRLLDPQPLERVVAGLAVAAAATAINLFVAARLREVGVRHGSPALIANARHLMTDVWSSVGVLASVVVVAATGWTVVDPVVALLVGVHVVRVGWAVLTEAFSSLMDARLPGAEERAIMNVLNDDREVRGFHRLRSRRSGHARFVEVDVFVAPDLTVAEAHAIANRVEANVADRLDDVTVTVHVEPFVSGRRDVTLEPRDEYGGSGRPSWERGREGP